MQKRKKEVAAKSDYPPTAMASSRPVLQPIDIEPAPLACSFGSEACCIISGVPWINTGLCWTSWCRSNAMALPPSASSSACCKACNTTRSAPIRRREGESGRCKTFKSRDQAQGEPYRQQIQLTQDDLPVFGRLTFRNGIGADIFAPLHHLIGRKSLTGTVQALQHRFRTLVPKGLSVALLLEAALFERSRGIDRADAVVGIQRVIVGDGDVARELVGRDRFDGAVWTKAGLKMASKLMVILQAGNGEP
jgi:hypothetical protein